MRGGHRVGPTPDRGTQYPRRPSVAMILKTSHPGAYARTALGRRHPHEFVRDGTEQDAPRQRMTTPKHGNAAPVGAETQPVIAAGPTPPTPSQ